MFVDNQVRLLQRDPTIQQSNNHKIIRTIYYLTFWLKFNTANNLNQIPRM